MPPSAPSLLCHSTAKTSIVTSIAYYLGWNFVTIDTADFLAYGLQNIASRMTYVFDRLKMLEKTVILFDEIEEFCLDREVREWSTACQPRKAEHAPPAS